MSRDSKPIIQTIRLDPRKLSALLEEIRSSEHRTAGEDSRDTDRVWINKRILVSFHGKHSALGQYEAYVRNMSTTGISFVHGVYVYPDTPCTITIHTHTGEQQCISATIRRCRHITGMIHEIGAEFESEIELDEFVDPRTLEMNTTSAPADVSKLRGTVLIIDDNLADQRLFKHALSSSSLEYLFAANGSDALEYAKDGPTFIICDLNLPDANGVDLIKAIRKGGYAGPIILATSEEDQAVRAQAVQAGAMETLTKPCPPADLKSLAVKAVTLAEKSPLHGSSPIYSTIDSADMPAELISEYVDELKTLADEIMEAIEPLDKTTLRSRAMMVKGSALGYGYAPLSHVASRVVKCIDEEGAPEKLTEESQLLISTCRRAAPPEGAHLDDDDDEL